MQVSISRSPDIHALPVRTLTFIANHFNERTDKTIYVTTNGKKSALPVIKFGALVGDHTKIGPNAVLSPGTILVKNSIVKRLELVNQ